MKIFYKAFFCFSLFLFCSACAWAHSVQIAYCVSCAGDLRIFVEHWHSTENPSTTTMTISLTINSTTTTQTASPQSSLINVPFASLPGCTTPVISAAACPGQANTYNDWVIYDYTGLPCGVPITFTIVSGNTVFTQDGCGMYPLSVSFNIPCNSGQLSDVYVCDGQMTSTIPMSSTSTWTNNNTGIGLPASGTGPIPPFTPVGPSAIATISYVSDCDTGTFNIIVNPQPVAAFNATTVCIGNPTQFTDQSTGGVTSWSWNFGDGNTSTLQNPSNTYAAAGNYVATLTVTGTAGCNAVISYPVTVYPLPVPLFNATTVCLGNPTQFTDQSTGGAASWNWSFGDGNTSTQQNPVNTYTASGNYTATLTVTSSNGCVATITNPVTVNPLPVANFSATTVCLGNPTQFSDQSTGGGTSWSWNFGDGNTSALQNPSNTYSAAGNYTATLTVTGPGGCNSVISYPVTVYPQPAAVFSATTVCLGNPTQFTDQSTGGATSWSWNFGDGNTSTLQSPSNTYTASGNYTATLNVSATPGGCTSTVTQVVTVYPQPLANFSATSVCINNPTQFTDLSTGGGTSWNWNFGDGNTSTLQNPSNTYAAAGNYSVTLVVTAPGGCASTFVLTVTVYPQASANFTATAVCVNTPPTQFTDISGGAASWNWNFGDPPSGPSNTANMQHPSHFYSVSGTYTVTLIAASGNGCADTIQQTITVYPAPAASFTATTVCFNNATVFTDLSSGTPVQWNWNFGDGNTDTQQNTSHTYNSAGTYSVMLIATNASGCNDTFSMNIIVHPLPFANFSATTVCVGFPTCFIDSTTISSGSITGWSWNFGDPNSGANNISNLQNPCHTFTAAGNYVVILTSTSNNACQSTTNLPVTVNAPPVAAFTANDVCLNSSTIFTNSSSNSVQWYWAFGDGNTDNIQNPVHTYLGYGTYVVTLIATSGAGCKDTVMDTLIVYPLPVVNFTADSVCVGELSSFSDLSYVPSGSISSWSWSFGDAASGANNTSNQQNPVHLFTAAGNYTVTLTITSNNGCISSIILPATVYPLPTADFSIAPGTILHLTDVATFNDLSAGGVVQWSWWFGDGDSSAVQNPFHLYSDTGVFVITLAVVSNNGCVDTIQYPVEVLDYTFYIPTAFTPNSDGKNDLFFGQGIGIKEYEMFIFDRWGNRIFYCKVSDLPQSQPCRWNGKVDSGFSEDQVQEDVYVWKVHILNVFDEEFTYMGRVSVVR